MKKLLSIALCVVITMSVCNISILAFVPTDYDDPNCIDIRDLGTRKKFMTANNICRCKTCRFDALTYSYLEEYVKKLQIEAKLSDRANYIHKQKAITWESGKYGAINVVLLTDTVAAYFHSAIRGEAAYPVAKVIYYAIMVSGSLAAIVCQYKQTSYELIILENNIKLKNIESILRDISREIEYKSYKNMNFILASSNYDINGPMAVAQFAKKDGLTYKDNYDDTYFNRINDKTKIILDKVKEHNKLLKDKPIEFNHSEQFKEVAIMLLTSLVGGAVIAFTIVFGPSITSRISKFFAKKQTDEIKKSPEKRAEKLEMSSVSST